MTERTPLAARVLPPDEWGAVRDPGLAAVLPTLEPSRVRVLVVERDGQIHGHVVLAWMLHAQGFWIADESRRHGAVARALLRAIGAAGREDAVPAVLVGVDTPDIAALVARVGGQALGQVYTLDVEGGLLQ